MSPLVTAPSLSPHAAAVHAEDAKDAGYVDDALTPKLNNTDGTQDPSVVKRKISLPVTTSNIPIRNLPRPKIFSVIAAKSASKHEATLTAPCANGTNSNGSTPNTISITAGPLMRMVTHNASYNRSSPPVLEKETGRMHTITATHPDRHTDAGDAHGFLLPALASPITPPADDATVGVPLHSSYRYQQMHAHLPSLSLEESSIEKKLNKMMLYDANMKHF
jgi:hypothetical protein